MNKIKIMNVVQTLDMGGLEKLIVDSVKFFDRGRFDFTVCCLSERGILASELENSGIEVIFLNKRYGFDLGLSLRLAALIGKKKIDILHTHNQRPLVYGALAASLSKVNAYVHTRHGRNDPDNSKSTFMSRFFSAFTDKIVCVSQDIYKVSLEKEKISTQKLEVIRNGIDINKFVNATSKDEYLLNQLGIKTDAFVIGTVGRLSRIKNQMFLMDAFKHLFSAHSDTRLIVIGDGPLKQDLIEHVDEIGLRGKVLFLGERKDVASLMKLFDVFVLPSLSEGISLVILEAMAAGLPIIATNVGGNLELIKEGENGFFVSLGNPLYLSSAIERLMQDSKLRRSISENNRKKALAEFDIAVMCKKYESLYSSLVKN